MIFFTSTGIHKLFVKLFLFFYLKLKVECKGYNRKLDLRSR